MDYKIDYTKHNKIEFANNGDTRFDGFIEKYMTNFFDNRIFSDFAKNEIYKEAENALKEPHDDDTVIGHWSGEFWGKLILSACRVCKYTKDKNLKEFIEAAALNVISFAREDGYINSYKNSMNVFSPDPEKAFELMGWNCDWNWNVWCRKYTLWGLIECAELTDSKTILNAAHKMATQLIDELNKNGVNIWDTGSKNFCGMPSGSIIKPMLVLYRLTEDEKLLKFCIDIAEHWDSEADIKPNIIKNALAKKPIHTWYPNSHLWAKAYEMMSCLDGLLELYRVTGTNKYLEAVICMYDLLKENELNVMCSVGFNDIFANATVVENALSEPCDVIHWIRVCTELFTLTGDVKYADSVEKAFYNAFLASVSDDGKWGARAVRSNCKNMIADGQSGTKYNQCCLDNIPRGYVNVTQFALMRKEDELYINMYCPLIGKMNINDSNVTVKISDGYIQSGTVDISVETGKSLNLCLRIPDISGDSIIINNHAVSAVNGYYKMTVPAGISEIRIDFNFKAEVHDFKYDVPKFDDEDFHILRWTPYGTKGRLIPRSYMMDKRCSFITYGPILLAKSKKSGMSESDIFNFDTICGKNNDVVVEYIGSSEGSVMASYRVKIQNDKNQFDLDMCTYATADDYNSNDERYFNIYV